MFIRATLLFLCATLLALAQVPIVPNELAPAFRTDLNASLQNAASITGSYSNPAWIASLAYAKITGVPAFATCTGDLGGTAPGCTVIRINSVLLSGLATGILKNTTGTGVPSIAVAGDFPTLNQGTTGNAATASALATAPSLCSGGNAPTGILANGNATGCAPYSVTIASGTSALGTSAIAANSCATVVTTTATGTAATDAISWTPNADISGVTGYGVAATDGLKVYPYPTTNAVNWRLCNGTGTSITPGAVTLNWRVVR